MSLLMDALKKAELAKRQAQGEGAASTTEADAQPSLALEPLRESSSIDAAANLPAGNAASPAQLPPLPSHLEELDAQFLAEAEQAAAARLKGQVSSVPGAALLAEPAVAADKPARSAAPAQLRLEPSEQSAARQSAAQNLFAAKQAAKPPARRGFAVAIGVFTVLAVCGIGGYFWWQLQPKTMLVASRPQQPAPIPPPTTAPAAPPAAALAAVTETAAQSAAAAGDRADAAATVAARPAAVPTRPAIPTAEVPRAAESPVHVTKAPLKVDPALIRGFDAFNRGDLAMAQVEYERAQKSDPRNTDALQGLAAIAVRQGRLNQAEGLYRQIAEADPQDPVAIAALINIRGQVDPGAAESRLKSLSAAQPELAAPHFSLGNLYARHGRWNDAQQAYFRAYSAEPDNPDILYNLAISLEHLRQNKLAAQYYAQAIAAAQTRPAGFDKAQAAARLQTLQP